MTNIPEEWLEKAISEGHINYFEYNKFTNPVEIGIGGFGKILKYKWRDNGLTVALKCLKVDTSINERTIKDFINELKLLRNICHHPNIIMFYGVTKDSNGYYTMILQYADEGTLREYLKANFIRLQWSDKRRIAREITRGLLFLHDNNIIHEDFHSKNILIHQKKSIIADFGRSKLINKTSMTSNSIIHGMPAYIEPNRLINHMYKCDRKSDIYSIGVILWEISSGKPPFQHITNEKIIVHISQGDKEEPIEAKL
ncbi:kinase-like protein [Gigaspora margarita]|uniref:Kinase-like protein n=1 Tax=Gigaspora margarita TaxID=4874 RepID=A0A8H4EV16_GIGMA|nr:kinase-like protein [Gigaspora margarita]